MERFDELIAKGLSARDRALLAEPGEPGYLAQVGAMARGRLGWTVLLSGAVQVIATLAMVYALWRTLAADQALAAVQWGVGAVLLGQAVVLLKGYLGQHLQANRVMREIKRVELQVALWREGVG